MKINKFKDFYIYRHTHIGFTEGGKGGGTPQREDSELDEFDYVFDNIQDANYWRENRVIGLAELDKVMNYCKYFRRENGNEGFYEREGKSCSVNGTWDGYHIEGSVLFPHLKHDYQLMEKFRNFLEENNWQKDWFELRDNYKEKLKNYRPVSYLKVMTN